MGFEDVQEKVILATGGYDHTINFWQAHSGVCQRSVQHPSSQVNDLEIMPNRQLLAAAGFQHIRMYDIFSNNPNPVINYDGVTKNITAVGFQEQSRWMYTGSEDNAARIWDLRTLQCQQIFPTLHPVNCVVLHPNQTELYIGDQGGNIYHWNLPQTDRGESLEKSIVFKTADQEISIQSIDIDPEGTYMAAVDNKGNCYLFSLHNVEGFDLKPTKKFQIRAHKNYALKCKFSPNSSYLVTTSADCSAKLWKLTPDFIELNANSDWNTSPPSPAVELKHENQRWVWDVAFSSDSQYIFTASSDNIARLWSVSTGEVKREYTGHSKALTALVFKD